MPEDYYARNRQVLACSIAGVALPAPEAIRLNRCDDDGIEVVHCPAYVRKWMQRERAEGGQVGSSAPA